MANAPDELELSYLVLRRIVGYLGIGLPGVVMLGASNYGIQDSISAYYYTNMRDTFVGLLFVIGIFMLSYRAYKDDPAAWQDALAGKVACISALGVALFPTDQSSITQTTRGMWHYIFAGVLFSTLAFFCLWLFTRSKLKDPDWQRPEHKRKRQRNAIYIFCGSVMLACIALMLIGHFFPSIPHYPTKFWLETIAIEAFGLSWLVKGQTFLADQT